MQGRNEMNKKVQKTIIAISVLAIVLIFAWFLKDILVPYIRLEIINDVDGARELLASKGIFGCLHSDRIHTDLKQSQLSFLYLNAPL